TARADTYSAESAPAAPSERRVAEHDGAKAAHPTAEFHGAEPTARPTDYHGEGAWSCARPASQRAKAAGEVTGSRAAKSAGKTEARSAVSQAPGTKGKSPLHSSSRHHLARRSLADRYRPVSDVRWQGRSECRGQGLSSSPRAHRVDQEQRQ